MALTSLSVTALVIGISLMGTLETKSMELCGISFPESQRCLKPRQRLHPPIVSFLSFGLRLAHLPDGYGNCLHGLLWGSQPRMMNTGCCLACKLWFLSDVLLSKHAYSRVLTVQRNLKRPIHWHSSKSKRMSQNDIPDVLQSIPQPLPSACSLRLTYIPDK